ncbi:hypothetical protein ALC56_10347 [Trachymyrmex septentrionalis]|uniref:Uncharacterized protein n=1 Tax=Trachymyrmex septentrionalis TaxID=34720 RepID=A0A195F3Y6_9HYME|nr:hypothetical protein ALC56_10347 [Trachymyrmex septentrionalis]
MRRWDRLTQTRKRLALEAECASFRYRREWAGYRGGYLHLEELQNLSNSTLHNTAGRTQAVNISAVQRMVGGKKEEDSEQKKQASSADGSSKIAATRRPGVAKLKNGEQPADTTGSAIPRRSTHTIISLLYVIVFGSGQLEKLFPAGRQIRTEAEARPAGFRRDIVSDGSAITRGGSEWPPPLRLPPPSSLSNLPTFLRVPPPPPPPPPRRSGSALRVIPPPVTPFRNKALHPLPLHPRSVDGSRMRALVPPIISTVPSLIS